MERFAVITPSHGPDFERCSLMHETLQRCCQSPYTHYIVIEKGEEDLFAPMAAENTRFLTTRQILPSWLHKLPRWGILRKFWLSTRTRPVRNWVAQQLVKLSMSEYIDEPYMAYVDSDVCFIRPFSFDDFLRDAGLRLFSVPGRGDMPEHWPWYQTATDLLGLPETNYTGAGYIGNIITWRRDRLRDLHRHIETMTGKPWLRAVCGRWHLSEYVLYGVYVQHVLGESAGHWPEATNPCFEYWTQTPLSETELAGLLNEIGDEHVSVMISSKAGIAPSVYRGYIERLLEASGC